MPTKLFVGNLNNAITRDDLGVLFRPYGKLTEYDLVRNYGFVHFEREEDALEAMKALNNKVHNGTELHIELSKYQHKTGKWKHGFNRPTSRPYDDRQGEEYNPRTRPKQDPYYTSRDGPYRRYPDREYSRPFYGGSPPPRPPPARHSAPYYREYYINYPQPKQIRGGSGYKEGTQYDDYEGFNRYEGYEGYRKYGRNGSYEQ